MYRILYSRVQDLYCWGQDLVMLGKGSCIAGGRILYSCVQDLVQLCQLGTRSSEGRGEHCWGQDVVQLCTGSCTAVSAVLRVLRVLRVPRVLRVLKIIRVRRVLRVQPQNHQPFSKPVGTTTEFTTMELWPPLRLPEQVWDKTDKV